MNTLQRGTVRSLSRTQVRVVRQNVGRRFAHDEHGHGHEAPKSEPLGTSFYTVLALIPASYIVLQISAPGPNGEPTSLTKMMNKWSDYKEQNAMRNAMHTRVVEQAGHDKNLFINTPASPHYEMRFPEIFGVGSPRAIPAGQSVDLSKVMAHYKEVNTKDEVEKLQRLKEGKIPGQEQYKGV